MNENVRKYLIKTIESMDDDNLLAVKDYIDFLTESVEEDPSETDVEDILKGRQQFQSGEYVILSPKVR